MLTKDTNKSSKKSMKPTRFSQMREKERNTTQVELSDLFEKILAARLKKAHTPIPSTPISMIIFLLKSKSILKGKFIGC